MTSKNFRTALAVSLLAIAAAAFAAPAAQAQTLTSGMAMICLSPATGPVQANACTSRSYALPAAGQLVLACNPATLATCQPGTAMAGPSWGDPGLNFQAWPVPASYGVLVCAKPLAAGLTYTTVDPCTPGADPVNKPFVLASTVQTAAAPAAPIPLTNGTAVMVWTAPTANTDGSVLTNLAGYNVYQGASAAALSKINPALVTATSYSVTGLAPGTDYFAVTAVSSTGNESAQTAPVAVTVPQAAVLTPAPPSGVAVSVTLTSH